MEAKGSMVLFASVVLPASCVPQTTVREKNIVSRCVTGLPLSYHCSRMRGKDAPQSKDSSARHLGKDTEGILKSGAVKKASFRCEAETLMATFYKRSGVKFKL